MIAFIAKMRSPITPLIVLTLIHLKYAQHSDFVSTKFDLSPDLPFESLSPNEDQDPIHVELNSEAKQTTASKLPSSTSTLSQQSSSPTPFPTFSPPAPLLPSAAVGQLSIGAVSPSPAPIIARPNLGPLPSQIGASLTDPQLASHHLAISQPNQLIQQAAAFAPGSVIPSAPSVIPAIAQPLASTSDLGRQISQLQPQPQFQLQPEPQLQYPPQLQPQSQSEFHSRSQPRSLVDAQSQPHSQPEVQSVAETKSPPVVHAPLHRSALSGNVVPARLRISPAALWFDESFDTLNCSKEFGTVASEFKRKFPKKAIPSGKDARLADILEKRLIECSKKSESSFWIRVAELLSKIDISSREKTECYNGLVEERLACFNLVSFTCQFVQQQYEFRLVPAKIVIQEARIAEDGAQKCRKLVRLVKERRQTPS